MLLELRIENLVLIESATIPFKAGLNALTGETGSGKSAIMAALGLIGGERADLSLIRHGSEKGLVEAVFDVHPSPDLSHLLEEAGLEASYEEPLIIRREISTHGKGRAFLNHQSIHISFLKSLQPFLFDLVGQHANQMLFSTESHRKIVDLSGDLSEDVRSFGRNWNEELQLRAELEELAGKESQRLRDIDRFQSELDELNQANLREGEDDELFGEYSKLSNAEELAQIVHTLIDDLRGDHKPIIPTLRQHMNQLDHLTTLDDGFEEIKKNYQNLVIELEEASYSLQHYYDHIENNPERAAALNERLALITKLKKKYGQTVTEITEYMKESKAKLKTLLNADDRIEQLQLMIEQLSKKNNSEATALKKKRSEAGKKLATALTKQLQSLNMPHVEMSVAIETQKRSQYGDDHVEFYIKPNKGERSIPVKECASGGELSRLLLSIQTLLAGKQAIPCLIFDEVDANIGGETATIVGGKLEDIAKKHQVLCITHFPQVAKQANHHLQITKSEKQGRTVTTVQVVKNSAREKELQRMHG